MSEFSPTAEKTVSIVLMAGRKKRGQVVMLQFESPVPQEILSLKFYLTVFGFLGK